MLLLSLVVPLADAPNPASCANHHCPPESSGIGVAVGAVVVIVVLVLLAVIAWRLVRRLRRRTQTERR